MHDPTALQEPSLGRTQSRWRKRLLLSLLLVPLTLLGCYWYLFSSPDRQLERAIAEVDKLDPGWRTQELEARRAVLADEANSAAPLMRAKNLMPARWPYWEGAASSDNENGTLEETADLRQDFTDLEAPVQLNERQRVALRKELARAAKALAEARTVAKLPHGRYPITFATAVVMTPASYASQDTHSLTNLLGYDILLRAQEQDIEGAMESCQALLNTSRSLGDEPLPETTLTRMLLHQSALRTLERILAQGEPHEEALVALQRLLEDESHQPLFLIGARAERATQDAAFAALQNGEVTLNDIWGFLGINASQFEQMLFRTTSVTANRGALMRFNTQIVELAKQPAEQWHDRLPQLQAAQQDLPLLARVIGRRYSLSILMFSLHDLASLRSAIVMLALERYRRARGHWPETLADLVPTYLSEIPTDPYDGAPLRLGPFSEGVVVYSVGEDGQDNGGNVGAAGKFGTDVGWRLWDVPRRRQLPKKRTAE